MDHDGGGWTLVAVVSDDGKSTWTWDNRLYWSTDQTVFGSVAALNKDYKSPAYHQLSARDLMFVHFPSQTWVSYHDVGDGKASIAKTIETIGGPHCWGKDDGYKQSAGSLKVGVKLCDTKLYFNTLDHDGKWTCGDNEHSYGPAWSANDGGGCPLDDPGEISGMGPVVKAPKVEQNSVGFGNALGLNKGKAGSGANFMWMLIRQ